MSTKIEVIHIVVLVSKDTGKEQVKAAFWSRGDAMRHVDEWVESEGSPYNFGFVTSLVVEQPRNGK